MLPPGFEIQLVVSDPDIGQPMNLNFDARGRLWISHSIEYPYPANGEGVEPRSDRFAGISDHAPRDRLTVVSGIAPDGKPSKIEHFVGGLNIPIGQTPIGDGSQALVYGIPSIFHCKDDDGDGVADAKTTLYTRFGNIDVHGNASSFTRWVDGWIYGCHGFSNHSEVRDGLGRVTVMQSGNSYRFREDGSQFEVFTHGQTNPFGLTFDPLGNLYSSDCHSMPVYLLLRGASYPGIGAKEDNIGFAPKMIDHNHGSTGICGPAYYAAEHFPEEYQNNLFICNPVTGQVHRDKLKQYGSTLLCQTQPDFITSSDKWFRPVDAIVGPDGALYIADFCNLVIGHYEAPLDDPNRDRTHGRVWRVVWRGENRNQPLPTMMPDLTQMTTEQLVGRLEDPNLLVRVLATNILVDAHAESAKLASLLESSASEFAQAHALWVLERVAGLDRLALEKHLESSSPLVRVHLIRLLAERSRWSSGEARMIEQALSDVDPFVRRVAADAAGRHPDDAFVPLLLKAWQNAPDGDSHLIHTVRMALRAHLSDRGIAGSLLTGSFDVDTRVKLLDVASATESSAAAPLALQLAKASGSTQEMRKRAASHVARHGASEELNQLIDLAPNWFPNDPAGELTLLRSMVLGLQEKGELARSNSKLNVWFERLVPQLMDEFESNTTSWKNSNVPGLPASDSPWGVSKRNSTDGLTEARFWDSIVGGESKTGILRSAPFALPREFSFWLCGHNGHPSAPEEPLNHVRLVHVESGRVLAKQTPARNDTAQRYTWRLPENVGQHVQFEIVDAHRGNAYAWIGAGRFSLPLQIPSPSTYDRAEHFFDLIGQFQLVETAPRLAEFLADSHRSTRLRLAALSGLEQLNRVESTATDLLRLLANPEELTTIRAELAVTLGRLDSEAVRAALIDILQTSSGQLQSKTAMALSRNRKGVEALLTNVENGKAPGLLVQKPEVAANIEKNGSRETKQRVASILSNMPPQDKEAERKIEQHLQTFAASEADPANGKAVFVKHCAGCHRVGKEGQLVGPQLDGIGNRGPARVLEDILDPNRNLDSAFRTTTYFTVDGNIVRGLERAREGKVILVIDSQGKELRIPVSQIEETRRNKQSLMPSNLDELITDNELYDVLAWLLTHRSGTSQK